MTTETTAQQVSNTISQDAPLIDSAATPASIATRNLSNVTMMGIGLQLAQAIAQIIASEQVAKPTTQAEWVAMGTALGAALKAYNAAP